MDLSMTVGLNSQKGCSQPDPATAVAVPILKETGPMSVPGDEVIIPFGDFIIVVQRQDALDLGGVLCRSQ
jgi:hypothetical protein